MNWHIFLKLERPTVFFILVFFACIHYYYCFEISKEEIISWQIIVCFEIIEKPGFSEKTTKIFYDVFKRVLSNRKSNPKSTFVNH